MRVSRYQRRLLPLSPPDIPPARALRENSGSTIARRLDGLPAFRFCGAVTGDTLKSYRFQHGAFAPLLQHTKG